MENTTHKVKRVWDGCLAKLKGWFCENFKPSSLKNKMTANAKQLPQCLLRGLFPILFFVTVWALLAFKESALLFRVNELSIFLDDDLFYNEMMSAPAGFLSYIACYLVQFFYNPVLGATIYVLLLVLVYWLTYKVFGISQRYRLLAMVPVVALLASNTQLGYWIFYIKIPGFYYVALLGVIASLLAAWIVKVSHCYAKPFLVAAWVYFAYPYLGVYAIASGVVIGIHVLCRAIGRKQGLKRIAVSAVTMVVAAVMAHQVPPMYYTKYTTVPLEEVYTVGLPASQWKNEHVPDNDLKEKEVSVIAGVNGRVGYPVNKELTKYKLNLEGSFSQKAIVTAKNELFDCSEINRPVDGKTYTFTFVGKDGREYYLDGAGGCISAVAKESGAAIPGTGYFTCVADKNIKEVASFRTSDGKYLAWNMEQTQEGVRCSVGLAASPSESNTRCALKKLKKDGQVCVADNSELFGLVSLLVVGDMNSGLDFQPLFVAGLSDGKLTGSSSAILNDNYTSAMRVDEVGFKPAPFPLSMKERSMWYNVNIYWLPFYLLLVAFVLIAVVPAIPLRRFNLMALPKWMPHVVAAFVALLLVFFSFLFWYKNNNFRIENEQNRAMWEEDWERVAELARDTDEPTRQIVMNRNIALLKLDRSGDEMFAYPEGSADIEASIPVRLAQTGGKMAYFQYGKFNFCYRWCVEDAVEYGWRIEYLKHAVRSMLLSGEYRLAERYIKILKRTRYYAGWAAEMEKYVRNPELIKRNKEFKMPLAMTCYNDCLDVDESYVEAYLTKNLTNVNEEMSRVYVEAALASALTRKDSKSFWLLLNYYVNNLKVSKLPRHYQEAVLLFLNLDKGRTVQVPQAFIDRFVSKGVTAKLNGFMNEVVKHKGMSEVEMAPYFKKDFGDTYFYFYFFVRNIKTN